VLVIPRLHYPTLADLPPELTGPLFTRVRQVSAAMAAAPGTDGSFIGVNTGRPAQARCTMSPSWIRPGRRTWA
jgi:diadenosine tetraphosphate (Ap4A) HIT family hydrolase